MPKKPRLCLNMIVKNEEHVIEQTLDCMSKYVDYYVISDTGSTDNTVEKIKNFMNNKKIPGEVFHDKWEDFGHNRSLALKHAKGKSEYIWVIDADDLIVGNLKIPKKLNEDSYLLNYGKGFTYMRTQIFKNFKHYDWNYVGVLHEYPQCTKPNTGKARIDGDYFIDSRRLGDRNKDPRKYHKDAEVLEKGLLKEPKNERYMFYLAQSYYDAGELRTAIDRYQRRIEMGGWFEEIFYSYFRIATAKEELNDPWDEVERAYLKAYKYTPERAEPLYRIAHHYRMVNDFKNAYKYAKMGIGLEFPKHLLLFVYRNIYQYDLLFEFSIVSYYVGEYQESHVTCKKLLSVPNLPPDKKAITLRNIKFAEAKLNEINKKTCCIYLSNGFIDEKAKNIIDGLSDLYNVCLIGSHANPYEFKKCIILDPKHLTHKMLNFDYLILYNALNCFSDLNIKAEKTLYISFDDTFQYILTNGYKVKIFDQKILNEHLGKIDKIVCIDNKVKSNLRNHYLFDIHTLDVLQEENLMALFDSERSEYNAKSSRLHENNGYSFQEPEFMKCFLEDKNLCKKYGEVFINQTKELVNFFNESPEALFMLAKLYSKLDLNDESNEQISKILEKYPDYNMSEINLEKAKVMFSKKEYEDSFNLCNNALKNDEVPESRRDEIQDIRDKNIDHLKDKYLKYSALGVKKIVNELVDRNEKNIMFSMTTCKRFDLFEKTINSFINCCLDATKIDYWLCVDDNSSEEDRYKMKVLYPFLNFVLKGEEDKGHSKSMNIIYEKAKEFNYVLHMEDDWHFIEKRNFVTECMKILEDNKQIGQALLNKNYAEIEPYKRKIPGGKVVKKNGLRYILHEHYKPGSKEYQEFHIKHKNQGSNCYWPHFSLRPSMLRVKMLQDIGPFYNTPHFEMRYADEYVSKSYISAFLDTFSCIHIGKKTWEKQAEKQNSYALNQTNQFTIDDNFISINVLSDDINKWKEFKEIANEKLKDKSYKRKEIREVKGLNDSEKEIFERNNFNYRRDIMNELCNQIDLFRENKSENLMVLWDDIEFNDNFAEGFNYLCETMIKEEYDLILLGSELQEQNKYMSGGYIISKRTIDKILKEIKIKEGDELFKGIDFNYLSPPIIKCRKVPKELEPIKQLKGYKFYSHLDSFANDVGYFPGKTLEELKEICDEDENCVGFNNLGYVKHKINPEKEFIHLFNSNKLSHGLYVKDQAIST